MGGQSSYVPPAYIPLGQSDIEAEVVAPNDEITISAHPGISGAPAQWSSGICASCDDLQSCIQYEYKMQLQSFAQAKSLDLLLYSSKREGKPHALQFQATVTIDGHSFESPGYFRTLKEAEHAAAKVALMSLSHDGFQEIYNEQIGELIDPTQRNLEIRDDIKHGFYVENLTEEYVTCYEDITQILIKARS